MSDKMRDISKLCFIRMMKWLVGTPQESDVVNGAADHNRPSVIFRRTKIGGVLVKAIGTRVAQIFSLIPIAKDIEISEHHFSSAVRRREEAFRVHGKSSEK